MSLTTGPRAVLDRVIPYHATKAVSRMFNKLNPEYSASLGLPNLKPTDFDWALHPGGKAIIDGVQKSMALSDEHIWASREVYRTRGNSSSATVLVVLDMLRARGFGDREHVVAVSFGPGMMVEMAMLRQCTCFQRPSQQRVWQKNCNCSRQVQGYLLSVQCDGHAGKEVHNPTFARASH